MSYAESITWCNKRIAELIDERDALGLQLAALRADNARMTKALEAISLLVEDGDRDRWEEMLDGIGRLAIDALRRGVDVTKEGE